MDDHELKDGMFTMFEIRLRIVVSKTIRQSSDYFSNTTLSRQFSCLKKKITR